MNIIKDIFVKMREEGGRSGGRAILIHYVIWTACFFIFLIQVLCN